VNLDEFVKRAAEGPGQRPGVTLTWGKTRFFSGYDPLADEINIGSEVIRKGQAPAIIAHELAHRREGTFTGLGGDISERTFWHELVAWESAINQGLSLEELDEELIEDSLGSYLAEVKWAYGEDSLQYRDARDGYARFKRRYL